MKKVAVAFSYPLCIRNFIHSGLLNELKTNGFEIEIFSPHDQDSFGDSWGNKFPNTYIPTVGKDQWGTYFIEGTGLFFRLLSSLRMRGYSIEYPNGSLQSMELSRPNNLVWILSWILVKLFPRESRGRRWLRKLYDGLGPSNRTISEFLTNYKPHLLITSTMGHLPLDFVSLTVAKKLNIPKYCILLSWDNLYSRGPVYKHPEKLFVWSKIMKSQALKVHQFKDHEVEVVGPLQFVNYADPLTEEELRSIREKFSLKDDDQYILYVCGGRTPQYDVEDILSMLEVLRESMFNDSKVIVRPHPQVDAKHYAAIKEKVLLDYSPSLININDPSTLFGKSDVRYMAALLSQAEFVVSSWGTTALLEACIFDKKAVQLNWMDSVPHSNIEQREFVRNFQKYYHIKEFDDYQGRLYSNSPADLLSKFNELSSKDKLFKENRRQIKLDFTNDEYNKVVSKICDDLQNDIGNQNF